MVGACAQGSQDSTLSMPWIHCRLRSKEVSCLFSSTQASGENRFHCVHGCVSGFVILPGDTQ
eukprot:325932-Ditylum_brightwellii.AAC.1